MARATPAVPVEIRRVCRSFERWRRTRKGRQPIPEPLWTSAAELAKAHGVFRTAQILHLDSGKLKRRVESTVAVPRRSAPTSAFVELMTPAAMGAAECVIEMEGPRGKMRISWKGTPAPDLSGLSRVLWEPA